MEEVIYLTLFVSLSSLSLIFAFALDGPYDYLHSLPDDVQERLGHCSSLPHDEKLLCQLEGAIDAQGYPNTTTNNRIAPPQTPPPSNMSCKFKEKSIYSLYPYAMDPSPQLNRVLEEYLAMHIRCKNLEFMGLDNINTSLRKPNCRYLIWRPCEGGLGNRIISLVSSFLYAIMSARVLLIDFPEWGDLFCEPFPGSTIQVPSRTGMKQLLGHRYFEFRDNHCGAGNPGIKPGICNDTTVYLVLDHTTPVREYDSVSCPMGFSRLRNVPFLFTVQGSQYFVPGFYANPLLSPLLDLLFPQRNVFHLLSRYLLTPNDDMWNSIRSNLDFDASRRFGVQIRDFKTYQPSYDSNIIRCISGRGGILSQRFRKTTWIREHVAVYIAALNKHHVEEMNKKMGDIEKESGKRFRMQWQVIDGQERHDSKHMQEAMIDMWVLSTSHVLIISRGSTFGYVATGLSGAYPYFIDVEEGGSCRVGTGVEPCFHAAPKRLWCDQDEPAPNNLQQMVLNFTMVKDCLDRPELGWTIVS